MKKLETVIKPYLLDALKEALREEGIVGMTISEIKEFRSGEEPAAVEPMSPNFAPRLKVEIVVADEEVGHAVETIQRTRLIIARSEEVIMNEVDDVIRIRTAEHGETAI